MMTTFCERATTEYHCNNQYPLSQMATTVKCKHMTYMLTPPLGLCPCTNHAVVNYPICAGRPIDHKRKATLLALMRKPYLSVQLLLVRRNYPRVLIVEYPDGIHRPIIVRVVVEEETMRYPLNALADPDLVTRKG